jgi:hypothetical protein
LLDCSILAIGFGLSKNRKKFYLGGLEILSIPALAPVGLDQHFVFYLSGVN